MTYTREQYLKDPAVEEFVDRLATLICAGPDSFMQTYQPARGRGPLFQIRRFVEAYSSYHFAGKGLEETAVQLTALSGELCASLHETDDTAALKASLRIFDWGGVVNRASVGWLLNAHDAGNLVGVLRAATGAMTGDRADAMLQFHHQAPWRCDSATTKLFAMADPMSAIYDSRVAAGIGWIVIEHCAQGEMPEIPEPLRFCVMYGAATALNRGALRLPAKRQGYGSDHALSNLRFNWILGELSGRACVAAAFGLEQRAQIVRAIEAALFMIGKRVDTIQVPRWPDGDDGDEMHAAA